MTRPTIKRITIVTPVFNEIDALPIFYKRLTDVIASQNGKYDFEILFTNNCSTDGTLEFIENLSKSDPSVQVITLSRNFGYTPSVLSGISHADGDAIVVIDVDCEDPPELIVDFISEWENGFDVVYGLRSSREESIGMVLGRKIFYRFTRMIADQDFVADMAEFSLFTKRVRDQIVQVQTAFPFIRSELAFVGFRRKGISYNRQKRVAGKSYLNIFQLIVKAIAFILTASTFPLRLTAYTGAGLLWLNFGFLISHFVGWNILDFASIAIVNFIFFTYSASFLSVYISRMYRNSMMRPIFIIDWKKTILKAPNADNFS